MKSMPPPQRWRSAVRSICLATSVEEISLCHLQHRRYWVQSRTELPARPAPSGGVPDRADRRARAPRRHGQAKMAADPFERRHRRRVCAGRLQLSCRLSVHRIKGDGTIGDEVSQPDNLEKGIYFHQVRATPENRTILVVARGNNPQGNKPEDPGSLHVYGFRDGVLSNKRKIAPNGGYGFGPRHLDIHPTRPLVYVSIERQNQLIAYKLTPEGDLVSEPLFTKTTLADPAHKFRVQSAGPIHIHPNGKFVYLGNRSGVTASVVPGVEDVDGRKVFSGGESNIAVFAIDQETGEPNAVQHADIRAAHPRTFALDASAKLLVAASLVPTAIRDGGKVVDLPAGLSVFRVGVDGKLNFVRKYDLDVGTYTQWWSGMVMLA